MRAYVERDWDEVIVEDPEGEDVVQVEEEDGQGALVEHSWA